MKLQLTRSFPKSILFSTRNLANTLQHNAAMLLAGVSLVTASVSFVSAQDGVQTSLSGSATAQETQLNELGISISVDGENLVDRSSATTKAKQNTTDPLIDQLDIQVKFDGLDISPQLTVFTADMRRSYSHGEKIQFQAVSNYPAWIKRSEIRIFSSEHVQTPIHIHPVDNNGVAHWLMPPKEQHEFSYVLRVYDYKNRYDETVPRKLERASGTVNNDKLAEGKNGLVNVDDNNTAFRNIPVSGGAITVYGKNVPDGYRVRALGEKIETDGNNSFAIQRILPPGDHDIEVSVKGGERSGMTFNREVNIPENEWFYVGLIDATLGLNLVDNDGEFSDTYTKGRAAFYVKGKIKGKYILTAAADTGENELKNLFTGLDAKNPRQLLKRIDPNAYYPVYGDDSNLKEDAPTSGKFYLKLERGDSHVMWGNFKTNIQGSEFLRNERTLYGASAIYKSEGATSFGERRLEAELYAAQPNTLPQRDVLRGTGGSAYFLKRQDISIGSETVSVEIRDPHSGRILKRESLTYGKDYMLDYIQGVIILRTPLSATAPHKSLVRDGIHGTAQVNLIVQYEYVPTSGEVDGYSYGGRGQAWANDAVRFGVTAMNEKSDSRTTKADQQMVGVDVRIRHSDTSFIEAEYAETKGPSFSRTRSIDGGLTGTDELSSGSLSQNASAWRLKAQLDLLDVVNTNIDGKVRAYFERKEKGFSSLDQFVDTNTQIWGAEAEFELNKRTSLGIAYDGYRDDDGKRRHELSIDSNHQISERLKSSFGIKHSKLTTVAGNAKDDGNRTDLAAKLTLTPNESRSLYVFGQTTANRSGGLKRNDRIGAGASVKISNVVGVEGEISYGTSGWGALAALTYDPNDEEHHYVGYRLDGERRISGTALDGRDKGAVIVGSRRRFSEELSAYQENNYDMYGKRRSLTSTYGISYTPDKTWTVDGGLELGQIKDHHAGNIDRKAISAGIGYKDDDVISAKLRGEVRFDEKDGSPSKSRSYFLNAGIGYAAHDDWKVKANLESLISHSDGVSIPDGEYIEASTGIAYRPVENDKLNALFKYVFLYDLPGAQQITANGTMSAPRQKSHVLSADVSYQLNNHLQLGAKYGFRYGKAEKNRGSNIYVQNNAHLGIVRSDLHIIKNWDALMEGRILWSERSNMMDLGVLAAIYRHFGSNVKAGLGYNFSDFSDDLTDLTKDDHGLFFNVLGKF